MKKGKKIISLIILIVIVAGIAMLIKENSNEDVELVTVKSEKELEEIYEYNNDILPLWKQILTLPFSIMADFSYNRNTNGEIIIDSIVTENATGGITSGSFNPSHFKAEATTESSSTRKRLLNYKYTS